MHRIFIIDDHPLTRAGLARIVEGEPDLEVCGELEGGRGAVDAVLKAAPHVVLLDLTLQDYSGLELIKDFRAAGVRSAILVVSMHDEKLYAERVLRAGGNGYMMKDEDPVRVVKGIRRVTDGETVLSDEMRRSMLQSMVGRNLSNGESHSLSVLTDREFEIFGMVGRGMPPRVISTVLGISPKTVDAHRANIKEKLGFASGSDLLRYAVRWVETGSHGPGVDDIEVA